MPTSLTLMMTSHNRPPAVLRAVLAALKYSPGNSGISRLIIVNDRGDRAILEELVAEFGLAAEIVDIEGPPGHRGQAAAWNAGFATLGDESHVVCLSSDCILLPGSVANLAWFAAEFPEMVVFGRAEHCGRNYTTQWTNFSGVELAANKTLVSSQFGMPEGFVWMLPVEAIRRVGGWEPRMTHGVCFDHTEYFFRLAKAGVELAQCDDVCAIHIEHPKPHIADHEAAARNKAVFESIHGEHTDKSWMTLANECYKVCRLNHPPVQLFLRKDMAPERELSIYQAMTEKYLDAEPSLSTVAV